MLKATTLGNVAALWAEIDECRSAIPCPVGSEDWQRVIMPHVVLSGTDIALNFYQRFLDEVREREKNKQGVIPNEKHRLLTDMIPPLYNLGIFNYFHRFGAVCVVDTYSTLAWKYSLDPSKPLESLARKYLTCGHMTWSGERYDVVKELVEKFKVDGAVLFVNRSCRGATMGQYDIANFLRKDLGIPSLIIDADHIDGRYYSLSELLAKMDAFMETL